ncbi:outer membrane protein assembly factor BamB family protein [Motilibacter aurantiacus]|uniref:outer membrane protein assembly factor BamB family protein n=1 Tax=Motilibacter aurantiacus TaxID=2714955 RepID=UPI00140A97BB|nr:PQQ-binding-like beta-propeller repeat protein [Motilibacter aurantiacus]NHC47305.1 PQQ-binding-like beta-propeller repeat protein [Motilibacter aurantiacus]
MSTDPRLPVPATSGLSRRGFLGLAAAGTVALGAGPLAAQPAAAAPRPLRPLRFALVTDTHINVDVPARQTTMAAVYAAVAAEGVEFALHCGDVTDTGQAAEYEAYLATIPPALQGKVHHVPGNHETRWDASAKRLVEDYLGVAEPFVAGGLRFLGLDPTMVTQEPAHFTPDVLRGLERELERAERAGTPVVLYLHHPVGGINYYADNQHRLLETIEGYDVRALLAGHVHAERVSRFNGVTELTFQAVRNSPTYYLGEVVDLPATGWVLRFTAVTGSAGGTVTRVRYADVPLTGSRPGAHSPAGVQVGHTGAGRARLEVRAGGAPLVRAEFQPYPEALFGQTGTGSWRPLAAAGAGLWAAEADVSALTPGPHKVQVRSLYADGAWHEDVRVLTVPDNGQGARLVWDLELKDPVQAGVAQAAGYAVVATTSGEVVALDVDAKRRHRPWRRLLGPVYRQPGVDLAGRTLFVPATDWGLVALDAATGVTRWRVDRADPVFATPTSAVVDGREAVFFAAASTLYAVAAADGSPLWEAGLGGNFTGRAACDGARVYAGSGDGAMHAFDARTGLRLWTYTTRTGTANALQLYGPWDDRVELLDHGLVLCSTVAASYALDRATGEERWRSTGSSMYPPALVVEGARQRVLLIQERGATTLVDAAGGAAVWRATLPFPTFNSGAVRRGGAAWVLGVNGQLARLGLADGQVDAQRQLGTAYCFSSPALMGDVLVAGDQDGVVRGVLLP